MNCLKVLSLELILDKNKQDNNNPRNFQPNIRRSK